MSASIEETQEVQGSWKCAKTLGRGAFGVVRLWKNVSTKEMIAVKSILNEHDMSPASKIKWHSEAKRIKELDHRNIVATVEPSSGLVESMLKDQCIGRPGPSPLDEKSFLCMEFCSGGDLARLLKQPENLSGLTEKDVRLLLGDISAAIMYLHENKIIHRDIKPGNILLNHVNLDENGKNVIFKLADLGLARDVSSDQSICLSFVGTHGYIAPEIYEGCGKGERRNPEKGYDKTVDFWSFGLIVYEASCGDPPEAEIDRHKRSIRQISCDIPRGTQLSEIFRSHLSTWLASMLKIDPKLRGKRFKGMLKDLLTMQLIEVVTPSGMGTFEVKPSTTLGDLQGELERICSRNNQLVLTKDGEEVAGDDLATKYKYLCSPESPRLYLLRKSGKQVKRGTGVNLALDSFIRTTEVPGSNDVQNRKIFKEALKCMREKLEFTKQFQSSCEALGKYRSTKVQVPSTELKEIEKQVRQRFLKLELLIEIEESLQNLENQYGQATDPVRGFKEQKDTLYSDTLGYFSCEDGAELPTKDVGVKMNNLSKLYERSLEEYNKFTDFKETSSVNSIVELRNYLVSFLLEQLDALDAVKYNVMLTFQNLEEDQVKCELLRFLWDELEELTDELKTSRLEMQTRLLKIASPSKSR